MDESYEKHQAEARRQIAEEKLPKGNLPKEKIEKLTDVVLQFSQMMTGITLHDYEREFGWRVIHSILSEDSAEITALFARQSGKTETVSVVVCGMLVMLPVIAQSVPGDLRLEKFLNGFWVGIYAPHYHQSDIMWRRMKARMYSDESKHMLLDPSIDIDLTKPSVVENMRLPNGSFVYCGTAAPQSKIEGETFHLVICEESQDMVSEVVRASIHPMAAATAGTIVKIGTCSREVSDFYEACHRNKRSDIVRSLSKSKYRKHFEFDYTIVQRVNERYRKYVEQEKERLGEQSDEFRMKYALNWILERGMFVNPDTFDACGITNDKQKLVVKIRRRGKNITHIFPRSPNVSAHAPKMDKLMAAIDVGKENSTVVTVGNVFWDGGVSYADKIRYPIHIVNWLELNDGHEVQHQKILDFVRNYKISDILVDATGKGDPVYERLAASLEGEGIHVRPFLFSAASKDLGYKLFLQELSAGRFTYPAGEWVRKLQKWKNFHVQMTDLRKSWRGSTMVVNKDPKSKDARDDFCDSAMMLNWLVNGAGAMEVETGINPLLGKVARLVQTGDVAGAMQAARERFKPYMQRRNRNRRSKWG
jgi:hypothetical protein